MNVARLSPLPSVQRILAAAGLVCAFLLLGCSSSKGATGRAGDRPDGPYLVVLGTAQDAGSPQVNSPAQHPARLNSQEKRFATCLGIVDPASGRRWIIEATPDFREQAWLLSRSEPSAEAPVQIDGVFVTHAHIGHYAGLMFLGHESMGARDVPVYAAPRMTEFLSGNGPWDQLVRYDNIALRQLTPGQRVDLGGGVAITPFLVPHRQEYSEVLGFRIDGPTRSVLFIPDIDSWEQWAGMGGNLIDVVREVDVAYLDATFYDNNEIPGRDMSSFPHPRITQTMDLLEALSSERRGGVRFIHLNHTNPAQWGDSAARREIERRGFRVADQGERIGL